MEWSTLIGSMILGVIGMAYLFWKRTDKLDKLGILHPSFSTNLSNSVRLLLRRCHFVDVIADVYKLSEEAEYVGFYDISDPVILIRSPELMKAVAIKNFDHFTDHRSFVDPDLNPLFGKNLIGLRGERWKEMRNLLSPAFTSNKMKSMYKLMDICGESFADYVLEVCNGKTSLFDIKDLFTRYTNDVIATCAFGISVDSLRNPNNDFYVLGKDVTNFGGSRGTLLLFARYFPKIAKLLNLKFVAPKTERFFENVVKETIDTRNREGITRPDMIQLMMESSGKTAESLTIQDMTAQAFIFFFGGFESTATVMCFAAHEIAANPEVQEKLRNEVDEVLRVTGGEVTYEAINGMSYLDAVISETLRLYPIGLFMERVCTKVFELPPALPGREPLVIQPGQNVWYPVYSIHRDPKYYPNPEKFDPERFIDTEKVTSHQLAYSPFGQGPRMCIANRFALLEIKVLLFHVMKKCVLAPREKKSAPMKYNSVSFNLQPKDGFWIKMTPRHTDSDKSISSDGH